MKNILKHTYFLAIIACLLWSTAFAGIKIGLKYTTPFQFAGMRFFLAGILILPLTRNYKNLFRALRDHPWQIFKVSLFQTIILYSLFYTGINMVSGAITAIIIGSQPLFAATVSSMMQKNDRLSSQKLGAISLGITGIILIAYHKGFSSENGLNQIIGILILLLANIASGVGNVFVVRQKGKMSPSILSSWQMIIGGFSIFILSLFIEPFNGFTHPYPYYISLGWLSFLSASAFTIWFYLLQRPGVLVSDLNIWKFIIPIFGAILSWLIIPEEKPEVIPIVGMIIIGASLIFYGIINKKKK